MKEALLRLLDGALSAHKTAVSDKDFRRDLKPIILEAHNVGDRDGREEEKSQWKEKHLESEGRCQALQGEVERLQKELAEARRGAGAGVDAQARPEGGGQEAGGQRPQQGSQKGLGDAPKGRVTENHEKAAKAAAAEATKRL